MAQVALHPGWSARLGPAADTLEDVTAEFGIASLAERLATSSSTSAFSSALNTGGISEPKRSTGRRLHPESQRDGSWALVQDDGEKAPHAFTPSTGDGFVEGTAASMSGWCLQRQRSLRCHGGTELAAKRLDKFFYDEKGNPAVTNAGPLHAELNNEPSIGTPWLYDFAGQPWKTQQLYASTEHDLAECAQRHSGNDDLGEMSPGGLRFAGLYLLFQAGGVRLGSPMFRSIVVHRNAGDIVIHAPEAAADAPYVTTLNSTGKKLHSRGFLSPLLCEAAPGLHSFHHRQRAPRRRTFRGATFF